MVGRLRIISSMKKVDLSTDFGNKKWFGVRLGETGGG